MDACLRIWVMAGEEGEKGDGGRYLVHSLNNASD